MRAKSSALTTILAISVALGAAPAIGQTQSSAPPLGLSPTSLSTTGSISDVFIGRNTVGPYNLSWKSIEAGSETVWHTGRRLKRDTDYTLDAVQGVLKFTAKLRNGQIARVDYKLVPGQSAANANNAVIPLEFKLFDRGSAGLNMNALFRPSAGGVSTGDAANGMMLVGFGGNAKLGTQSDLSSKLYFDPRGGNLGDRGAIQLTDSTRTGFGRFGLSYSRAGRGFAAGEETGIGAGKEILEATGSLDPIRGLQAGASFRQTSELAPKGAPTVTTVLGQKITGNLAPNTRLLATRTDTKVVDPDGASTSKVADRIQIDQKVVNGTQATALFERNETRAGESSAVTQTTGLSVRSQPTPQISLQGDFRNRLLGSGPEDQTNLKFDAAPTDRLKIGAVVGERYNRKSALHQREASFEYSPTPNIGLAGLVQARAEGPLEELVRGISASARPFALMEFSGGVKLRDAQKNGVPEADVPDTVNVKVALRVWKDALKFTGGIADNPEDDKGAITRARSRSLGVQSTLGEVDLSGGFTRTDERLAARTTSVLDLSLGWRFLPASHIVTGYRGSLTEDAALVSADTYTLNLVHRLGTALDFSLSGAVTRYERDRVPQPLREYRAEARLGLRF